MAEKNGKGDAATEAGRGVTRSIVNGLILLASIGLLAAWSTQGFFKLEPGESAVILRLGSPIHDTIPETEA